VTSQRLNLLLIPQGESDVNARVVSERSKFTRCGRRCRIARHRPATSRSIPFD
jgi:hypothetical protein